MLLYGAIIYFIIFIFIFEIKIRFASFGGNPERAVNQRFEKIVSLLFLTMLWLLTAFRGNSIGNDTVTYIRYFERINNDGINPIYSIELGFQWLIYFISRFTDNPHVFIVIISTLLYIMLGYIIYKNSKDLLISCFLSFFLCFGAFCNIIRQSLAMMICFIGYTYLKAGKIKQFVLFVLLSSIFHKSALIVLLLLLFKYIPKSKMFFWGISAIAILLSHTSVLLNLSHFLGDEYTGYFNSQYANSGQLGTFLSLIKCVLIYLIIRISDNKNSQISEKEYGIMYANTFFMFFFFCCGFTVSLISRLADYFILYSILDVPSAMQANNSKKCRILFVFLFVYVIVHFLAVQFFRPEWNHLYPYEFWR